MNSILLAAATPSRQCSAVDTTRVQIMMFATQSRHSGQMRRKFLLTLKIMLALMAFVTATSQVIGLPMVVAEFELIGFGRWFRYVTALILIAGSLLMLRSATTVPGALLLCTVCVGAFAAHLLILHGDLTHTIIPAVLLGIIA